MLKKIANDCRKATLLIEKKQAGRITISEKLELKIHLAGCSLCRIFEQQSEMIDKLVFDLFHEPEPDEFKLDNEFKKAMQGRMEERLNKN